MTAPWLSAAWLAVRRHGDQSGEAVVPGAVDLEHTPPANRALSNVVFFSIMGGSCHSWVGLDCFLRGFPWLIFLRR